MNYVQDFTYKMIVNALLNLPWDQRADVVHAVNHNGIFCPHCGIGELQSPNPRCQCENDE